MRYRVIVTLYVISCYSGSRYKEVPLRKSVWIQFRIVWDITMQICHIENNFVVMELTWRDNVQSPSENGCRWSAVCTIIVIMVLAQSRENWQLVTLKNTHARLWIVLHLERPRKTFLIELMCSTRKHTHPLDKMASISQTTLSIASYWMKIFEFRLKFHWSLFLRVQLTIRQHWLR